MFTVEIKINGALIGHVYARNLDADAYESTYHVEYYKPESRKVRKFKVKHKRSDRAEKLLALILEKIR